MGIKLNVENYIEGFFSEYDILTYITFLLNITQPIWFTLAAIAYVSEHAGYSNKSVK